VTEPWNRSAVAMAGELGAATAPIRPLHWMVRLSII